MQIFITGGCKNGKSTHAQNLAAAQQQAGAPLYYLATMLPRDNEDRERVARHRQERAGMGFLTVEQPRRIEQLVADCDPTGSLLLDSLTALLQNEMFREDDSFDLQAYDRVAEGLERVLDTFGQLVIVSDYLYSQLDGLPELTMAYCEGLARLDRLCAARCQVVLELCCGQVTVHKGRELYEKLL